MTVAVALHDWSSLQALLRDQGHPAVATGSSPGLVWIEVARGAWLTSAAWLHREGCATFIDLTVTDLWLPNTSPRAPGRFVVQLVLAAGGGTRVALRTRLRASELALPSVTSLWPGANWFEREAFDLYGLRVTEHPDLRRILLYAEFMGHPLRKDYEKQRRQPLVRVGPLSKLGQG
ncbi:MAG: NADH-quinone oxidoreductase subunit C [Deltaproteobacteria bacterium]|nr:NADH-quinone oxidoreductase subunit C [Deltaproteobacteria bacterium]